MQKQIEDAATADGEPQILVQSLNGDFSRPNRTTFTVVGNGTIYVDTVPEVAQGTGVPFTEGVYGSDEGLRANETLYAVAADGDSVDVRLVTFGPKVN